MIPELHQLFWEMTGENVASTFFHAITREGTYCNHLTGVAAHPEFQCFKKMPVLLIADQRCSQIVVWGIDRVKEGYGEWADERVSYHFFPNYFCSDSTRHSPVYYLLNISDAVRQFFSHAPVPCRPQVMTVLQTNSNIWNYEQMTNISSLLSRISHF